MFWVDCLVSLGIVKMKLDTDSEAIELYSSYLKTILTQKL